MSNLLYDTYQRAVQYQATLNERPAFPSAEALENLSAFDKPLPEQPLSAEDTLHFLDTHGSPATVASTGGRYFGFVTGGALPAAHAANWLATTWDQNGVLYMSSPVISKIEEVALRWVIDVLHLPTESGGGFVTGATMANFTALAAARHWLLNRKGWDVEAQGLFGAPEIKVVVGDEVHVSVLKALAMVGLGRERVIRVPVDDQGRMLADQLPPLDDLTIVCIQSGNVNSGAFDPARAICEQAQAAGAWVHVDGAFGLWALATPELAHLGDGIALADSWATDAHKWLNVPYDSGIVLCKHTEALAAAMSASAAYLTMSDHREPAYHTPEFSRRGRAVDVWAALRTLGREGIAELVERNCRQARRFAEELKQHDCTIHNDVVLNQVVVSFGTPEFTDAVIQEIQREGTFWAGRTVWHGHNAMRISVSGWATTDDDITRSIEAVKRVMAQVRG